MISYRTAISALIVGIISAGNNLQTILQTSSAPTKWQMISIIVGGVVLALNDIKSRVTPPELPKAARAAKLQLDNRILKP